MNMTHDTPGALDFIVFAAMAFAAAFTLAWGLSPRLRDWIEQPKYRFQKSVEGYDKVHR